VSDHRSFALPGATPHYGPDKTVVVLHIDLDLRPDLAAHRLEGICTTSVRAIEDDVRRLVLDAVDLEIESVTRVEDGAELAFRSTSRALEITLDAPLARGDELTFAVAYAVENPTRGLYFIDHEPQHAWTQSQDSDARAWFPCFDYPADKQTSSTTVHVPKGMFALANGALASKADHGDETVYSYEQRIPHPTYLMTMVVGPFSEIAQPFRFPLFYYTLPGREADGERAFGSTPRMIETFERVIGVPYAYERYSQIAVADFIFGGMENTSATTQTDRVLHDERAHLDYSADFLAAHELAHQWFGDLVTCRDWSQAWLNEGFATYFEAVWLEADLGWDEYLYDIHGVAGRYFDEDADRYRRPIVCNVFRDPIELFDRHLYEKGGAVLHMLRGELGWPRMQRALKRYVGDNAGRNVETIDLVRAIENETGRNMRRFFAQWVERAGHPTLDVAYRWDKERKVAVVTVAQKQKIDDEHPAYVFDLDVGFVAAAPSSIVVDAGDVPMPRETRVRLTVDGEARSFAVPFDAEPALVRVDPQNYVLAQTTWTFDTDMSAAILRGDASPLARIQAAKTLRKDGSRTAREALATALAADPFWGVAAEVAALLGASRSPSARAALLANVTHPHPKVRRAVAEALGNWRDAEVATALLALRDDASYFVVATAYHALGKTRDERALDALIAGVATPSWNETIAAGALRGLGHLGDARALPLILAALDPSSPEAMRRAAVASAVQLALHVNELRTAVVDAVDGALRDPGYLVRMSALAAAERLEDARLLPALDRMAGNDDGRERRDAAEAAIRVREAAEKPAELARMREELDKLRAESAKLRERVDLL
jgi:aminopeptidase N